MKFCDRGSLVQIVLQSTNMACRSFVSRSFFTCGLLLFVFMCSSGCGGGEEMPLWGAMSAKGESYNFAEAVVPPAKCSIDLRPPFPWPDKNGISVEDDYLPRVVYCEVGQFKNLSVLLRAQAIAARTFMHSRLKWDRDGMSGTTDDQVYFGRHCDKAEVPKEFKEAVNATRGLVMMKGGTKQMPSAFYRNGLYSDCRRYRSCDGEPCMGQMEAAGCAAKLNAKGKPVYKTAESILEVFYGPVDIVQTKGPCVPDPIEDPTPPDSCFLPGYELPGTCMEESLCDGNTIEGGGYLCPGSSSPTVTCCLPREYGEGEVCSVSGHTGTCQNILASSCDTGFQTAPLGEQPYCPGSKNVKCCLGSEILPPLPATEQPYVDPYFRWIGDPCTDDTQCTIPGGKWSGRCEKGFCTQECDRYCPDLQEDMKLVLGPFTQLIRPATFCVPLKGGRCVPRRDFSFFPNGGCRSGSTVCLVGRASQPRFKRNACIPDEILSTVGGSCEALFNNGKTDAYGGESLGGPPTPEGDEPDYKDDSGCSLSQSPSGSLPWLLLLLILPLRRRRLR